MNNEKNNKINQNEKELDLNNPSTDKEENIESDLLDEKIIQNEDRTVSGEELIPDDPRHGVISSRPDLFDDTNDILQPDGKVSDNTEPYDEENIKEYKKPD